MKVLTWNISSGHPSNQSPSDWDENLNIFEILKIIEVEDPDIFCLQELPSLNFGKRFKNYTYIEHVKSHAGFVGVFVKKMYKIMRVTLIPPLVAVEMSFPKDNEPTNKHFLFVGCHLYPYKQNHEKRIEQMRNLFTALEEELSKYPTIVAGDMNMRENETMKMISTFGLEDAYLKTHQNKGNKYTWDSRINLYRKDAFQFICRFDRIFIKNIKIIDFNLIGNEPVSKNINHFLSDHFGISATIEF